MKQNNIKAPCRVNWDPQSIRRAIHIYQYNPISDYQLNWLVRIAQSIAKDYVMGIEHIIGMYGQASSLSLN